MPSERERLAKAAQPATDALRVAVATAMQAQQQGIARLVKTAEQLYEEASATIEQVRTATRLLMNEECIPPVPVMN